jgi:hypothetical protein
MNLGSPVNTDQLPKLSLPWLVPDNNHWMRPHQDSPVTVWQAVHLLRPQRRGKLGEEEEHLLNCSMLSDVVPWKPLLPYITTGVVCLFQKGS